MFGVEIIIPAQFISRIIRKTTYDAMYLEIVKHWVSNTSEYTGTEREA